MLILCLHAADSSTADLVMFQEGVDHAGSGVPYSGTRDTRLVEGASFGNVNWGTNEFGTVRTEGLGGLTNQHSLLSFDDIIGNGIGQIPLGSTVNSATLTLRVQNGGSGRIHRMVSDWSENTATYNNFQLNGNTMAGLQADNLEASSAFTGISGASGVDVDIDVTSDVQAWVNGTSNFGWGFLPPPSPFGDDIFAWWSSDASIAVDRPLLSVDFTPIPETSSVLCLGLLVTALCGYSIGCKVRRRRLN
jgi:hypothetical protein